MSLYTLGQDYSLLSGARSEGLAHASVSVLDAFSTFHNPSLLSWNDENWIGMSGRNNFSISTMNSAFGSIAYLFIGRTRRDKGPRPPKRRILPPDDDPDFLRRL